MARLLVVLVVFALPELARADAFDNYLNPILGKVPGADGVKQAKELSAGCPGRARQRRSRRPRPRC